jgi:hypothetical protein
MTPLPTAESLEGSWKCERRPWSTFNERLDREQIPYLSHTKLVCHERCPRCYYRRYVLCEMEEPSNAMLLGQLFHQSAREYYHAIRNGREPKAAEMIKALETGGLPKDSVKLLRNAVTLLRLHRWHGHDVVSLEEPFFMDLARGLPPMIGIPDLVLRRHDWLLVVDHKTSKSFNDLDSAQLLLYAEHLRRRHATHCIVGVFDEYRLVPDLAKVIKPAFRRTPVSVDRSLLAFLIRRYRKAWKDISNMRRDRHPAAAPDCWKCNGSW